MIQFLRKDAQCQWSGTNSADFQILLAFLRDARKLLKRLRALTRIERVYRQFSPVQFGLSQCKHVQLVRRDLPERRHRVLACQRGASAVTPEWAKNRARTRRLASGPLGLLTAGRVPIAAAVPNYLLCPFAACDIHPVCIPMCSAGLDAEQDAGT